MCLLSQLNDVRLQTNKDRKRLWPYIILLELNNETSNDIKTQQIVFENFSKEIMYIKNSSIFSSDIVNGDIIFYDYIKSIS